MQKSVDALRTIGEVSRLIGVQPHVLRYWETQFPQLAPIKRPDGRRYYRSEDLYLAAGLVELLREDGMTTRGAQKQLARDKGAMLRERGRARLPETFGGTGAEAEPPKPRKPRAAPKPRQAEVTQDTAGRAALPDAVPAPDSALPEPADAAPVIPAADTAHDLPWQQDMAQDAAPVEADEDLQTSDMEHPAGIVLAVEPSPPAASPRPSVTAEPLMRLHALAARLRDRHPEATAALARQRAALAALLASR